MLFFLHVFVSLQSTDLQGTPENLLDYVSTLQEELVDAGVLPRDYDFEGHRELVGMQPGDAPVTYAGSRALEEDYGFRLRSASGRDCGGSPAGIRITICNPFTSVPYQVCQNSG